MDSGARLSRFKFYSALSELCSLGQVTLLLCASASPSSKMGIKQYLAHRDFLGEGIKLVNTYKVLSVGPSRE